MEQQPNHIDLLLRQRLADASVAPPDFVWPNVERELRKKKRRLLFFWFLAAGIAGLSLFSLIRWQQHKTNGPETMLGSGNAGLPEPQYLSEQHETAITPTAQTTVVKEATPNTENARTTETTAVQTPLDSKIPSTVASVSPAKAHADFVQQQSNAPNIKHFSMRDGSLQSTAAPNLITTVSPEHNITRNSPTGTAAETSGETTGTAVAANSKVDETPAVENTGNKTNLNAYRALTLLPQSTEALSFSKGIKPATIAYKPIIRKQKDTKNCYDFNRQSTVLLVDVYGGPSFTRKGLAVSDTEHGLYREQRLHTERKDWAYNAGIRASVMLQQHILLRTGLHYDQFTEVFEFIDPNYVHYNISVTFVNGHEIRDTTGFEYGDNYVKTYNRFGLMDIPLQAGVELRSGRTGVSINAGASVNVLFWKRGAILSQGGDPTYFTPNHKDNMIIFRERVGLSAVASVQWFYHLSPRWRIFAEPYYRQTLRPVTIPSYPVEQRYNIWGVRMGVTTIVD